MFERVAEGVEWSNRGDEMDGGGIVVRRFLFCLCNRRLQTIAERTIDEWPSIVERMNKRMNKTLDGWYYM